MVESLPTPRTPDAGLRPHLRRLWRAAGQKLHEAVNTETLRIAVTGLARSGKTVFITSAVQNLMAFAQGRMALPIFADHGVQLRLKRAEVLPPDGGIAPFPFARNFAALAQASPHWPERTTGLSGLDLKLVIRRKRDFGFGFLAEREATLSFIDYPGEWLLDLPLVAQTYAEWCAETLGRLRSPGHAAPAAAFLENLASLDPAAPHDEARAHQAAELYRAYLFAARDVHKLRFLQPGAYFAPPEFLPPDALGLVPLDIASAPDPAGASLASVMQRRFEAYKAAMRTHFFDRHFRRFDRQLVLVDVLGALHAGAYAFDDTRAAIERLASCFGYGRQSLINPFARSISRVVFAATKADHVPDRARDALQILLGRMAGAGIDQMREARAQVRTAALASVRCTQDDLQIIDGRGVPVVRGLPLGGTHQVKFDPGEVPLKPPDADYFRHAMFDLPAFTPPRLDASGASGVPHIGLDEVLFLLMGDRM